MQSMVNSELATLCVDRKLLVLIYGGRGMGWKEMNVGVKILIAAAVLIPLGLFVSFVLVVSRNKSALEQELNKLEAAGEPLSVKDIRPAPVPDKDNAALIYKNIFSLMSPEGRPFTMENKRREVKPQIKKLEKFYRGKAPLSGLSKNEKTELYSILDSQLIEKIIKLAEQAAEKPASNFNLDYDKGYAMPLPHLNYYRGLSKILAAKAWQLANEGKPEKAVGLCIIGLKQARVLRNEPVLISQMVYYACSAIVLKRLNKIIAGHGISNRQGAEVIKILKSQNLCESMKTGLRGERVMALHDVFNPALEGRKLYKKTKDFNSLSSGIFKSVIRKDCTCYLKLMNQLIASYNKKYWEIPTAEKESKYWEKQIPFYCILSRMLLPALDKCRQKTAERQILFDKTIITLLLEKYKNEHGKYPASLTALGQDLPKDPFTGKDFSYQLQGKSYKLISAGDKKE
jgi:hypothetical protein